MAGFAKITAKGIQKFWPGQACLHWDGKESWTRLAFHGKSPIAFAVVDPDHAVAVDQDRTNDFMRAGSAHAPYGSRVFERLTYAAQVFFSGVLP